MEDVISQLNTQVEEFEFEVENIQSRSRKKSSNEQVEALEKRIDRHKWHLDKLEQVKKLFLHFFFFFGILHFNLFFY